jgi:hypothetical protein
MSSENIILKRTDRVNIKELSPLGECQLGDIIQVSEGKTLSIRAIGTLPEPALTMAGFVILGEFDYLISAPSREMLPHVFYKPLHALPPEAGAARVLFEGVCRYWAPHLPGITNAMSELPFRVIEIPGNINPWVIVYRGPELIVFINVGEISPNNFQIKKMQHNPDKINGKVARHTSIVNPAGAPSVPSQEPQQIPIKIS